MPFKSVSKESARRAFRSIIHDGFRDLRDALGFCGVRERVDRVLGGLGESGFLACYGSDGRGEIWNAGENSVDAIAYAREPVGVDVPRIIADLKALVDEILADDDDFGIDDEERLADLGSAFRQVSRLSEKRTILIDASKPYPRPDHLLDAHCLAGSEEGLRAARRKVLDDFFRTADEGRRNLRDFKDAISWYLKGKGLSGANERRANGNHFDLEAGRVFFDGGKTYGFKYGPLRTIQSWLMFRYLEHVRANGPDSVDEFSNTEGLAALTDHRFAFLKAHPGILGLSSGNVAELEGSIIISPTSSRPSGGRPFRTRTGRKAGCTGIFSRPGSTVASS